MRTSIPSTSKQGSLLGELSDEEVGSAFAQAVRPLPARAPPESPLLSSLVQEELRALSSAGSDEPLELEVSPPPPPLAEVPAPLEIGARPPPPLRPSIARRAARVALAVILLLGLGIALGGWWASSGAASALLQRLG